MPLCGPVLQLQNLTKHTAHCRRQYQTLECWNSHLHHALTAHTHTRLTALCLWLPRWAGTRKVKPIWILLKQETVSGSGISWAICKSAHRSRQITMPAPHYPVFYRPDALPASQPTVSKHWRNMHLQHTLQLRSSTTDVCSNGVKVSVIFILLQKTRTWFCA